MNEGHRSFAGNLPKPAQEAYFPPNSPDNLVIEELLRRAGPNNLDYALLYGSTVTNEADTDPTSRMDLIAIVPNVKAFYQRNITLSMMKMGRPRSANFHSWLNKFGFNYYNTEFLTEKGQRKTKLAVIPTDIFIKGCHGFLEDKENGAIGKFGYYVAGRMHKVALNPIYKSEDPAKVGAIETAINFARIDGAWYAMNLLSPNFSLEELIDTYVPLSYKADVRAEKKDKAKIIISQSREDYEKMLTPILEGFEQLELIHKTDDGRYIRNESISKEGLEARLAIFKLRTIPINYLKNPVGYGIMDGIVYAWEKIMRARKHKTERVGLQKSGFRRLYESKLEPVARNFPLSANEITFAGAVAAIAGILLREKDYSSKESRQILKWLGHIALIAGYGLDAFDGQVARAKGTASIFGALWDSGWDRVVDGLVAVLNSQKAKGSEKAGWELYTYLNALPSFFRSLGIQGGANVKELDVGSRAARCVYMFIRGILPDKYKEAALWGTNLATAVTSYNRLNAINGTGERIKRKAWRDLGIYTGSFLGAAALDRFVISRKTKFPVAKTIWQFGVGAHHLHTKHQEEVEKAKNKK